MAAPVELRSFPREESSLFEFSESPAELLSTWLSLSVLLEFLSTLLESLSKFLEFLSTFLEFSSTFLEFSSTFLEFSSTFLELPSTLAADAFKTAAAMSRPGPAFVLFLAPSFMLLFIIFVYFFSTTNTRFKNWESLLWRTFSFKSPRFALGSSKFKSFDEPAIGSCSGFAPTDPVVLLVSRPCFFSPFALAL